MFQTCHYVILSFIEQSLLFFWDSQEAGYEHPTLENLDAFREELIQELEEGILPIIEKRCYQNPSAKRNKEEFQIPQC